MEKDTRKEPAWHAERRKAPIRARQPHSLYAFDKFYSHRRTRPWAEEDCQLDSPFVCLGELLSAATTACRFSAAEVPEEFGRSCESPIELANWLRKRAERRVSDCILNTRGGAAEKREEMSHCVTSSTDQ